MKSYYLGVTCGVLGLVLLIWPATETVKPKPVAPDVVGKAFDTYEQLWRKLAQEAADRIDAGEFTNDRDVWEFLAQGQEPARKIAFEEIAKSEQDYFNRQGGWSALAHSKMLRSYAK